MIEEQSTTYNIRYDMSDDQWERLITVYEGLPGWRGAGLDGCAIWRPSGPDGGDVIASVEPSGLQLSRTLNDSDWTAWERTFLERASAALSYQVKDAET